MTAILPRVRVLVTGGAGFVGANLMRRLLANGTDVRVLDDFSEGREEYVADIDDEIDVRVGTITDARTTNEAVRGAEAIVHLAAMSGVAPSIENPYQDFLVNTQGTFNVLEAARLEQVSTFIFASSGAVLAGAEPPLREDLPSAPLAPYGASKMYGESAVRAFSNSFGFCGVSLRFSNVYGPYCRHKASVVATFLHRAMAGNSLPIYGDGLQTRDFVHVDDITAGICRVLEVQRPGTYHLGTGVETSILQLATMVQEVTGGDKEFEFRPARIGEAARNFADISLSQERLGWSPRVSLPEGLSSTHQWMRQTQATSVKR